MVVIIIEIDFQHNIERFKSEVFHKGLMNNPFKENLPFIMARNWSEKKILS